ncbi:hypothetical protein RB653_004035 [Dictyostelium firmibasis]|uniref:Uncharacterized protein n=1 Tax=Dictyostelium firmibasis TaxID=79012 RepID=A0AAN7U9W8_9MYCE
MLEINYNHYNSSDMEMNNTDDNNAYQPFNETVDGGDINIEDVMTPREKKSILSQFIPTAGDYNALTSVFMDNLANFALMVEILVFGFGMPRDLVTKYFIPGPAFAIMIGSLSLSAYAIYLDRNEKRSGILYTAIPLGLDTPSTIGLPLLVCGPAFLAAKKSGMTDSDATYDAWIVGCATVFLIGCFKLVMSVLSFTTRQFHAVGKASALAGIGLALLGLDEILTIFEEPVVGWVSLWILLLSLLHRHNKEGKTLGINLPFNISGVLVSCVVGTVLYYFMTGVGISVSELPSEIFGNYYASYPHPSNIFKEIKRAATQNMSIVIPYAILVNISSISVIDGARSIGNSYKFKWVLLIDSISTIIGSFFGCGVTQTTPYIGHLVYHNKFKAGSSYSTISGLVIGLGGFFGYLGLLTNILPKPAILPIFIFICFEICYETLHNTKGIKPHHSIAIIWAFFPSLFQFAFIIIGQISPVLTNAVVNPELVQKAYTGITSTVVQKIGTIMILANGFICTALFWGTSLAFILENQLKKASIFLAICSVLTFFGIIHSVDPNAEVYVPWNIASSPTGYSNIPYHWSAAYLLIAAITFGFSFIKTHEIHHPPTVIDDNEDHNKKQSGNSRLNRFKFWKSNQNETHLSYSNELQSPLL